MSAEVHHAFYIGVVRKLIKDSNQSLLGLATLNEVVLSSLLHCANSCLH